MKKKTKEIIIEAAIDLFNELGVQNVTSRSLAKKIGISHGNLDYHFNTKEALLIAIYEQMREEMTASYEFKEDQFSSFEHFHRLMMHIDKFQSKYRFFNLDVLEISRSNPEVAKILKGTLVNRKEQMQQFFNRFLEEGLIVMNEDISFERLQHTIRIIITFWLPQQELLIGYKTDQTGIMPKYIWELLIPVMTIQGKKEYHRILESLG
ncbi:TetR/AcrR family transcriptional regulator [Joostella sp.]